MAFQEENTERLLAEVRRDPAASVNELLELHRNQLRKAVAANFDRRLSGRVDPSDVIQETLIEANRRLPEYLNNPQIPFYPWLRAIAMNRLTDLYRRHILAQKRSLGREVGVVVQMSDQSAHQLAERIVSHGTSPSEAARSRESRQQVRAALETLPTEERQLLTMMYLEDMSAGEVAVIQGVSDRSVRRRHRHALEHLARILN